MTSTSTSELATQGDNIKGAGNRFSNIATYNLNNQQSSHNIEYWYETSASRTNPLNYTSHVNTNPITGSDTSCPGIICWSIEPSRPFELKQNNSLNAATSGLSCKAYPNPTSGSINFEYNLPTETKGITITVYDEYGRVIAQNLLNSSKGLTSLSTATWMSGIYFYRISSSQKNLSTGSFIVNNKQ